MKGWRLVATEDSHLCLGDVALWAAEIGQPGTAVELAVGGLDLVGLEAVGGGLDDQRIKALDLLDARAGDPSDDDGVASVPRLEDGEGDVGLGALAREESSLGGEGQEIDTDLGERSQSGW